MTYEPERHHRRSIRLQGYDYAQAGAYFVTICVHDRACLLGEIVDGEMRMNDAGCMVHGVWDDVPNYYAGVELDAFVVMPNHVHGIVVVVGAGPRACPNMGQPQGVAPTLSLPDVVHRFKTLTTRRYVYGVKQHGWPLFPGRVWQRNYYEHIIRNDESLNRVREYIANNPVQWELDRENPNTVLQIGQPRRVAPTGGEPWHI
jgi:putative transposase